MVHRILSLALLAAVACGGTSPRNAGSSPPPVGLATAPTPPSAAWCAVERRTEVIDTPARWDEVWPAFFACSSSPPPVPQVDFTREMVVFVSTGARPSAGYAMAIRSAAVDAGGALRVDAVESCPEAGKHYAALPTYPVALARVDRSDATPLFTVQACDDPRWPPGADTFDPATGVGCKPSATAQTCEVAPSGGVTCRPACPAGQYELACSSGPAAGAQIPQPDPALGCAVLPVPTPSSLLLHCCPGTR